MTIEELITHFESVYPGQDLLKKLTELLQKVDFNENQEADVEELMKFVGKTTEKAS